MNADLLKRELIPSALEKLDVIDIFETIDSTNDEAMRGDGVAASSLRLVVAEQQTAGKGRRGRQWSSEGGAGIYMSLAWPTALNPSQLQGLSLAVGVSLAQSLNHLGFPGLTLKWPNDILYRNNKLAGILLEFQAARETPYVVIGMGVNLRLPQSTRAELERPATDLQQIHLDTGKRIETMAGIEAITAGLVSDLLLNLDQFAVSGFAAARESWMELDANRGKAVRVINGQKLIEGVVAGVGTAGQLILETDEGVLEIVGGELAPSLRTVEGLDG